MRSALREPQDPEDSIGDAFFESLTRDLDLFLDLFSFVCHWVCPQSIEYLLYYL